MQATKHYFKTKELNLFNYLDDRKKEKENFFNITWRHYTANHTAYPWDQNGCPQIRDRKFQISLSYKARVGLQKKILRLRELVTIISKQ